MLKGKELYREVRKFGEDTLVPAMNDKDNLGPEVEEALAEEAVLLGIALLTDIAESLHRISVKVG